MPRASEFAIHVDSSCLTDSTDLKMPSKRSNSDQTVIHNEPEDLHSENEESQLGSEVSRDEHTEALIRSAARAVIASIEQDGFGQEDSVLSSRTEEGCEAGTELTYEDGTELTYGDDTELSYDLEGHDSQDPYDGSGSSNHEDDVFSQGNPRSNRSSLNSCTDDEEHARHNDTESLHQHQSGQSEDDCSPISRMPSTSSHDYALLPEPLTITSSPVQHTPSKVLSRPPFRTPSSVRAMQMSSPTPSIFSGSTRSGKRPTVSRLGTPRPQDLSPTKNKTPTRFKAKKEYPLVLLHVTVLPLHWTYGDAMDAVGVEGLPRELHGIKESWKLLQEKLGDMVLERGILLPHPQDSYEVLEERLLEALELPVRPRARILSCGHYLGPDDGEDLSSEDDSESEDDTKMTTNRERWCDICGREVIYQELGIGGKQKRFRVKVYASNGLMRAGAWAAAWREMERVDIEIVPFVASHMTPAIDSLMAIHAQHSSPPQFEQESEHVHQNQQEEQQKYAEQEEAMRRQRMEEERMREIYGHNPPQPPPPDMHEARAHPVPTQRREYGDSLPELLLEALKVLLRDKKHVAICILSILVIVLALRPHNISNSMPVTSTVSTAPKIATAPTTNDWTIERDTFETASHKIAQTPEQMVDGVKVASQEAVEVPLQVIEAVKTIDKEPVAVPSVEQLPPAIPAPEQKILLVEESDTVPEGEDLSQLDNLKFDEVETETDGKDSNDGKVVIPEMV